MTAKRTALLLVLLNLLVMSAIAFVRSCRANAPKGEGWRMTGLEMLLKYLPRPLQVWLLLSTLAGLIVMYLLS